jgi:hypothetical protein
MDCIRIIDFHNSKYFCIIVDFSFLIQSYDLIFWNIRAL